MKDPAAAPPARRDAAAPPGAIADGGVFRRLPRGHPKLTDSSQAKIYSCQLSSRLSGTAEPPTSVSGSRQRKGEKPPRV